MERAECGVQQSYYCDDRLRWRTKLVQSQAQHQVDWLGPTRLHHRWQAKEAKGFAADAFTVDWQQQCVTCPEGKMSASWTPAIDGRHYEVIKIKFSSATCSVCPSLA